MIDYNAIPKGQIGVDDEEFDTEAPNYPHGDIGQVRMVCQYSHMTKDDPLVFPGQPGAAHLHAFFGNTLTDAFSTADSLRNTGASTCYGGTLNRSAYWVPALIDANGIPQRAVQGNFYYKAGYELPSSSIQPFPTGLRMIAGSAASSSPQPVGVADFGCDGGTMRCPDGVGGKLPYWCSAIPSCGKGARIVQHVGFPQCWDGKNLDSPDHKSHMAYPVDGACPADHPVAIPHIEFLIEYVQPGDSTAGWHLSSDMYDQSMPGGFSGHGDYFSGWKQEMIDTFVRRCDQLSLNCGDGPIGDGRVLTNKHTWDPFPN